MRPAAHAEMSHTNHIIITLKLITNKLREFQNSSQINSFAKVLLFPTRAISVPYNPDEWSKLHDELNIFL